VSAFVPHTLPDKQMVVVGIDIEAKDWNHALWQAAILHHRYTRIFIGDFNL